MGCRRATRKETVCSKDCHVGRGQEPTQRLLKVTLTRVQGICDGVGEDSEAVEGGG